METPAADTVDLVKLARDLEDAKRAEDRIIAIRRDLEDRLVAAVGFDAHLAQKGKTDGSKTYTFTDAAGAEVKFTVKRSVDHKLDLAEWERVRDSIPAELQPIRTKLEPEMKGYTWLRENNPDVYQIAVRALVTKPGRASISFKE